MIEGSRQSVVTYPRVRASRSDRVGPSSRTRLPSSHDNHAASKVIVAELLGSSKSARRAAGHKRNVT